jgi:hypothetical protein
MPVIAWEAVVGLTTSTVGSGAFSHILAGQCTRSCLQEQDVLFTTVTRGPQLASAVKAFGGISVKISRLFLRR